MFSTEGLYLEELATHYNKTFTYVFEMNNLKKQSDFRFLLVQNSFL